MSTPSGGVTPKQRRDELEQRLKRYLGDSPYNSRFHDINTFAFMARDISDFAGTCSECGKCCDRCSMDIGYFDTYFDPWANFIRDQIKKVYNFTKTKGFLGKHGCKLPRWLRSVTCQSYMCSKMENAIRKHPLGDAAIKGFCDMEKKIRRIKKEGGMPV